MTTNTEKKPVENSDPVQDKLGEALSQHHLLLEACEAIAFGINSANDLTIAELNVFRQAGIVDRGELNSFLRRCRRAEKLVETASSKIEYTADKMALGKAEESEKEKRPELEMQITKMQAELDSLGMESKQLAAIVETKRQARELLLKFAPPTYVEESAHMRRQANGEFVQEIGRLQNRLMHTELVAKHGPTDAWSVNHARLQGKGKPWELRHHPTKPATVGGYRVANSSIDDSAWSAYRKELVDSRDKNEKLLAELERQHAVALTAAKEPLRYYARKYNL